MNDSLAFRGLFLLCVAVCFGQPMMAQEKLILMGGNGSPKEAVEQFTLWAGGQNAQILILPWATESPAEQFADVKAIFAASSAGNIERGLAPIELQYSKSTLLAQIEKCTGVFFPGGDQVVLMKSLNVDPEIRERLLMQFRSGRVFGGTSAGTAIMSRTMLTGNGDFTVIDPAKVETSPGFGLVSEFVLDQHFIARQRQNRLISVLQKSTESLGIGIDEATALIINGRERAKVVGAGYVMAISRKENSQKFDMELFKPGSEFQISMGKVQANP